MDKIKTYRDLIIWRKSMDLARHCYLLTKSFPVDERFGLVSQINRSVVSVASNIAEGFGRKYPEEFRRFLNLALGSLYEFKIQIELSKDLGLVKVDDYSHMNELSDEIGKMINTIQKRPKVKNQMSKV
jgi:four helix bundle protein